jgi:DNA-binding SARP family transcriptional activator/tetratricopeptide (TPR) repeat protein
MAAEFRLLGEVTVHVDGRPVDLGPARQRCVLAALAVDAGRLVPVERLAERVWGTDVPRRGRATLQSYISRLRRALAAAATVEIVLRSGGYALVAQQADRVVDVHRFRGLCAGSRGADDERARALLEEALGLWRGAALTGLDGDWAEAERDRLANERQEAEHDLTDVLLRLGHGEDLLAELSRRAVRWPSDERVAGQYMLALHRAGRTASALAHYQRVRDKLVEELGADPGTALQDLHLRLLTDAPAPSRSRPGAVVVPVPRQLPPDPVRFIGRDAELAALTGALDRARRDGTVMISTITGAGGIGKTWLALHWAHQHAADFAGGQLYVDLQGYSPAALAMNPATAVRGFITALGFDPQLIPPDPHAQIGLYRSLVADKRLLVVLENVRDSKQATPLLPGSASCTVLITSRHRLEDLVVAHGTVRTEPRLFAESDARTLFGSQLGNDRVTAEPDAVTALVAGCGGHPLALGIAAARAGSNPSLTLASLAEEVIDPSTRLDALSAGELGSDLRTVLGCSFRGLGPEAAAVFSLMGLVPGTGISTAALAALAGLPARRAGRVLRELEALSLVSQYVPGRYRMHDLVHLYAAEQPSAGHDAALRRWVEFYLHTAYSGERLLYPHRLPIAPAPPAVECVPVLLPDEPAALAWFDTEHSSILAAQHLAAEKGWNDLVWQIAWSLSAFHRRRGHIHADISAWRAGLVATQRLGDPALQARAHRFLSHACARLGLGRETEAVFHLQEAVAHGKSATPSSVRASLAWTPADRQAIDDIIQLVADSLRLYQSVHDTHWEADAYAALGWLTARTGKLREAHDYCRSALALFRRHQDHAGESAVLDSLGHIALHAGENTQAVTYYHEALSIRRTKGDTDSEADTLSGVGEVNGMTSEARAVWRRALAKSKNGS